MSSPTRFFTSAEEDNYDSGSEPASEYNNDDGQEGQDDESAEDLPVLVEPTSANPPLLPLWPAPDDDRWGFPSLPVVPGHILRKDTKLDGEFYVCDGRLYVKRDALQKWTSYVLGHCRSQDAYDQIVSRLRTDNRVSELQHLEKFWDEKREGHPFYQGEGRQQTLPSQQAQHKRTRSPEARHVASDLSSRGKRSRTPSTTPLLVNNLPYVLDPRDAIIRQYQNDLERLMKELTHYRDVNATSNVELDKDLTVLALRSKISDLTGEVEQQSAEMVALKAEKSACDEKARELQARLVATVEKQKSDTAVLKEGVKAQFEAATKELQLTLEQEKKDSSAQIAASRNEKAAFDEKERELQVQLKTLLDEVEKQKVSNTAKSSALQKLKQTHETTKAAFEAATKEVEHKTKEVADLQQQLEATRNGQQLDTVNAAELEFEKKAHTETKQQLEHNKVQIHAVNEKFALLQQQLDAKRKQLSEKSNELTARTAELDSIQLQLQEHVIAKQKLETVTTERNSLNESLETTKKARLATEDDLVNARQQMQKLEKQEALLRQQYERMENDNKALRQQVEKQSDMELQHTAEIREKKELVAKLREDHESTRRDLEKLSFDYETISTDNKNFM